MNVRQALKLKTKLISEIRELEEIVKSHNSKPEGAPQRYDIESILSKIREKIETLTDLKTKIHTANLPAYSKIFKMAELKSHITFLKKIPTEEGKVGGRFGSESTVRTVVLDDRKVREKVKEIESMIETLQEELDLHNGKTQI